MRPTYSNKFIWYFMIVSVTLLLAVPLTKLIIFLNQFDFSQLIALNNSTSKNILKPIATFSLELLLSGLICFGLLLIIALNRQSTWARLLGCFSFGFLIFGLIGTLFSKTIPMQHYFQISATMPEVERGIVWAKIQFDGLDPTFQKMLIEAKEGKIQCFIRPHLESTYSYQASSEVKMNQTKKIMDKENVRLDPAFLDGFLKDPYITFEFMLTDKNAIVYKDLGPFLKGKKLVASRLDTLKINNRDITIPNHQLLVYFLFKDLNDKPIAVFF